ncbi:unnamed protein product [Darwinula stevensoni]|uniref:DAGKc domain-containing protein n=1 Tax=Darwinula stevensoni TaxID=69355 RepID=A0A7R8X6J5_9CRUS|nr:unnamed protein product [Darwinula stevensoni]CAG0882190.1 unnamed protein product [Darwinula stevensoni]
MRGRNRIPVSEILGVKREPSLDAENPESLETSSFGSINKGDGLEASSTDLLGSSAHTSNSTSSAPKCNVKDFAVRVYYAQRSWKHRWKLCHVTFRSTDQALVSVFYHAIRQAIAAEENRPKNLLIFINPYGGKKQAKKIFEKHFSPLLHISGIQYEAIETTRARHAYDHLQTCDLEDCDGIVAVGGDGMFSEILNGILIRTAREGKINLNDASIEPLSPKIRLGMVPAGSSNALSQASNGTLDPLSAVIHIILGDRLALDVCAVRKGGLLLQAAVTFMGYGFVGDVLSVSEQLRCLGPTRYLVAGAKVLFTHRSYKGEVWYRGGPPVPFDPLSSPPCLTGCTVCKASHLKATLRQQSLPQSASSFISPVSSNQGDLGEWKCMSGRFLQVGLCVSTCDNMHSPGGLSPRAHFGDGHMDLLLVKKTSFFNYIRFLLRLHFSAGSQYQMSFASLRRVQEMKYIPREDPNQTHSIWNCDGEIQADPALNFRIHCQLVEIFSRGIEDFPRDPPSCFAAFFSPLKSPPVLPLSFSSSPSSPSGHII